MALPQSNYVTEDEYLAFERDHDLRHEYVDGEILAMSGGSVDHGTIIGNLLIEIAALFGDGQRCRLIPNDLKVKVSAANAYRYPDIVMLCDPPEYADDRRDMVTNPTVIIEVLSDSTETTDRIAKLHEYRQLPSLQAYLLVSQHMPRIERYQRQDANNWLYTDAAGLDNDITLPGIAAPLTLAAVYRNVDFDAPPDEVTE